MIPNLFYILAILLPLIFTQRTSELFEFNKMILIYLDTTLVVFYWLSECIKQKRLIFKRTILTFPLIFFIITQGISTVFSIDQRTSIFGYYGRWNGGLMSVLCYSVLYFAFVSLMNKKNTVTFIKLLISSAVIVSVWAIFEHFGRSFSCLIIRGNFDTNCWVQDIIIRPFASFGQPNWLAAYIAAISPFVWIKIINKNKFHTLWLGVSVIFYIAILFTKSRSAILAVAIAFLFWGLLLIKVTKHRKKIKKYLIAFGLLLALITFTSYPMQKVLDTQVEPGGTESGEIRKIVWIGALNIWRHYPLVGSGVETFSFAYNNFKLPQHNLTSEWDFNYSKAHNEYLNYLATSGLLGLTSYLILICYSIKQILKSKFRSVFLGYITILITNFFGFSTSTTSLLLFLFPALAITQSATTTFTKTSSKYSGMQKIAFALSVVAAGFIIILIINYWRADTFYAQGLVKLNERKFKSSRELFLSAYNLSPNEPIYSIYLAQATTNLALGENSNDLAIKAVTEADTASNLSPYNLNIKKIKYSIFTSLSSQDPKYIYRAREEIIQAIKIAPNDPELFYFLGLVNYKVKLNSESLAALEYALMLKPDYKKAVDLLELVKTN